MKLIKRASSEDTRYDVIIIILPQRVFRTPQKFRETRHFSLCNACAEEKKDKQIKNKEKLKLSFCYFFLNIAIKYIS